jgi:hypothetical protein
MSEHMLMFPEGDHARRRHAHSRCVMRARQTGRLLSREEWRRTQPREPSIVSRLIHRLTGRDV